jgi:Na+/H+ antiporter NhaC
MPSIYVLEALTDSGHMSILVFSMMIAGMVGIISKNGGMAGIVARVSSLANTARHGQISTALMGTVIFFDDYANTLVVGNTMRPITDKLKISRQKLAYIVDSTAAPVASLALITTWIGFEVGLIDEATQSLEGLDQSAYSIFLSSIPFGFYSIFALAFVYLIAVSGRDFGPMARAEERAKQSTDFSSFAGTLNETQEDDLTVPVTTPPRSINAIIPLSILIIGTFAGIYVTGRGEVSTAASFRDIIGAGDSYKAMVWASTGAVIAALILTLSQKLLSLGQAIDAWVGGIKYMTVAVIILTLAWSLAGANEVLHTAEYLASILGDTLTPAIMPTLVFILAAMMAFATGTSWGVMGIMIPLVIPLTWSVLLADASVPPENQMYVLYSVVAALLTGSVWGDHCSPISDTTILSSMASDCDHIEHVRTQLPYAMFVAVVALLVGIIPSGYGFSPLLSLPIGLAILIGGIFLLGRKT